MAWQVPNDVNDVLLLFWLYGLRLYCYLDFLSRRKLWRAYLDRAVWPNHRACMYHRSHRCFTLPFRRTLLYAQFPI